MPIWNKLAWAFCVLEGAKLLLWQQLYSAEIRPPEIAAALDLVEESLDAVVRER